MKTSHNVCEERSEAPSRWIKPEEIDKKAKIKDEALTELEVDRKKKKASQKVVDKR